MANMSQVGPARHVNATVDDALDVRAMHGMAGT